MLCGAIIQPKGDNKNTELINKLVHPVLAIVYDNLIINPTNIPINKKPFRNSITFYILSSISKRILSVKFFRATNRIHTAGIITEDLSEMRLVVDAVLACLSSANNQFLIKEIYSISGRYSTKIDKYIDLKAISIEKKLTPNFRIQYDSERHSALILRRNNSNNAIYIFNSGVIKCIAKNKIEATDLLNSISHIIESNSY
jgi:hypothetical protein